MFENISLAEPFSFNYKNALDNLTRTDTNGDYDLCDPIGFFSNMYLLFIIIIGVIGNSITIIIFIRTKNSQFHRARFFLISLAISDSVYLLVLVFYLLEEIHVIDILNRNFICQITVFATYVASFMSSSIVLAFTVQRVISIAFPLKHQTSSNTRIHSKIIFFLILSFACLFYSFSFWGYVVEVDETYGTQICKAKPQYENLIDQLNIIDTVFTFCIPFTGILLFNLIIIKKLKESDNDFRLMQINKTSRQRQSQALATSHFIVKKHSTESSERKKSIMSSTLRHRGPNSADATHAVSRKVTKMLLVVSSVFLLLNLPYHSYMIYLYIRLNSRARQTYTPNENCILTVFKQIFNTSFACNFFLYSIAGTAFRIEFKRSFMNTVNFLFLKPFNKIFQRRSSTKSFVFINTQQNDNENFNHPS